MTNSIIAFVFAFCITAIWFGPPITVMSRKIKTNGRNNFFYIVLKERPEDGYRAAIWAQEFYELKSKRRNILKALFRNKEFLRKMEIVSHEVEALSAAEFGADLKAYRKKESEKMAEYKNGIFNHFSAYEINSLMENKSSEAAKFVTKHWKKIESFNDGR